VESSSVLLLKQLEDVFWIPPPSIIVAIAQSIPRMTFLAQFDLSYDTRWRDFGLVWVYIFVNIGAALGLYWAFRVPKRKGKDVKKA
jgi:ABC-type multidrug transport system permease subunit